MAQKEEGKSTEAVTPLSFVTLIQLPLLLNPLVTLFSETGNSHLENTLKPLTYLPYSLNILAF